VSLCSFLSYLHSAIAQKYIAEAPACQPAAPLKTWPRALQVVDSPPKLL
jgi:hypothetical protein